MKLPWKVARAGRKLKTKTITILTGGVAMREPLQRSTTNYTGKRLDERIGSRAANDESILIQIVEEVSQQKCTNRLQNNGPSAKCGPHRGWSSRSSINTSEVGLNVQGDKAGAGLAMVENRSARSARYRPRSGLTTAETRQEMT
ncbi:hypothetical protein VN97_g9423 [Penicillium thymicola]|uniref:Uncharacterized protein n=1 Tax=Penicillium thymicola TaxID=293382 RepID=A0AAI9TBP5_PENTH|nr:hypothetical protein VN97_g9423 [Penicillium thymicola]